MKGSRAPIRNIRRGKRPWMVDLRYLGGRREYFATEDMAKRRREEVLKNTRSHGTAALALPYTKLVEYVAAEKELGGVPLGDVIAFWKAHHQTSTPIKFKDAIERFQQVKAKAKKAPEYVRKLRNTLMALARNVGEERLLSTVERPEIETWLYRDDWKLDTIRSHRINIRTFFSYAHGAGWVAFNPAAKLEPVERSNKPPGILTPDECEGLLRGCQKSLPYFLPYVVLNLFCGIRPEEVARLIPENIHETHVEVPAYRGDQPIAKSRKRRLVDLSANGRAWLDCAEPIVPKNPKWLARQLPKLRAAAKLERWPKNCLRHSFASYHLAMHGSADKTATQMGHEDTKMLFEHYRALVTKAEAERFWAITPQLIRKPESGEGMADG